MKNSRTLKWCLKNLVGTLIFVFCFIASNLYADNYQFQIQWGGSGTGNGIFNLPTGIGVGGSGNIYVSDSGNNLIQKFNSSGVFQTQWGGSGTGNGTFNTPIGIGVDGSGNIYVSDSGNNLIQKFNSSGVFQTQWGGSGTGNGKFNSPTGIGVDSSGNIYVADTLNNLIQKFNSSGVFQTQWGGSGTGNGTFGLAYGVAVDSTGNVYVADTLNNLIQKFNSSGVFQTQWGGSGIGNGKFGLAYGVAVDSAGNVYLADAQNNLIQKFNSSGVFQTQWGGSGTGNGQFALPFSVAVDSAGNVYVADTFNNLIQKFVNAQTVTAPGAPGTPTATASDAQATVFFTPPASNGGSAITKYTVTSNPAGKTATGTASPITITGLTNGTAYTFTVTATNAIGTGPASGSSNIVTPTSTPSPTPSPSATPTPTPTPSPTATPTPTPTPTATPTPSPTPTPTPAAGTINLPQTGQTSCWDASGNKIACTGTRQDGDIQAGAAWPNPRFKDNGDQTMTDNLTGLIWAKNAGTPTVGSCTGGAMVWTNSLDYIACLNTANYLGHNDWRLPNINELESLVNAEQSNPATWLGTQGYTNVQSYYYWSSSTFPDWSYTYYVFMGDGGGHMGGVVKSASDYVWPVRGGQSGSVGDSAIWATGQTQSYYPGDDGAIQAGVAWPNPRFTDNGDGTVTDNLAGLMWTKNANLPGGYKTWQQALDYVASMNAGSGTYGHSDWRLPNRKELRSLVDYSKSNPTLPTGYPFTNVRSGGHWSSSTRVGLTSDAWYDSMSDGSVGSGGKSGNYYVWPVRAGQVGNLVNLVISHSGTGSGTVTSSDGKINCGSTCSASYNPPITTTLSATASSGSNFTGWSGGGCSGTGTCILNSSTSVTVTATFTATTPPPAHHPVRDFNGDGHSDILLQNLSTGAIGQWLMNGTSITGGGYVSSSLTGWQVAGVGDFNGDGYADILLRNSTTGAVVVWLMNGTSVTGGGYVSSSLTGWQVAGVGDFNGDGYADILLRNSSTGALVVWLMNGTAITSGGYVTTSLTGWQVAGVGDFNGDGKSDILLQNTSGALAIWLLNGSAVTGGGYVSSSLTGWRVAGVGDFDGDGHSDILWKNSTTGAIYVWLMNGTTVIGSGYVTTSMNPTWKIT